MTDLEFARRAALIATKASRWSFELIMFHECKEKTASPDVVARFADEIQSCLDSLIKTSREQ